MLILTRLKMLFSLQDDETTDWEEKNLKGTFEINDLKSY